MTTGAAGFGVYAGPGPAAGTEGAGAPTPPREHTMFKTLAARALVPVACTLTGFVVVCSILLYSSMKADRIRENTLYATDIAAVIVKSTRHAMLKDDRETLQNIVANVGQEHNVEHVRIFNKKGLVVFSSLSGEVGRYVDKDAEGCSACHGGGPTATSLGPMEQVRRYVNDLGRPVLAVTAPIYNEPACLGGCHYHAEDQSVLGTLDVGLSEAPFRQTLTVMGRRLTVFCLMVLVLSVGGVAALLQVNVMGPVRELRGYVEALVRGDEPAPLARRDELGAIARAALKLYGGQRKTGQVHDPFR